MRREILAFGILIIYAVSSIYLERIVFLSDPLLKTILAFLYFFLWISPLIYFWRKAWIREELVIPIAVLILAILYISPLSTITTSIGRFFPDVDFHAAKVLYCSTGHFFNDPVTSYPSIYPPVYHILVGTIMRLLGSNDSWYILSRFHIGMLIVLFLSVYFLARFMFNPRVGLLTILLFGAVSELPNWSLIFFPTPFLLGLTFMVNAVTLVYLSLDGRRWYFYAAGLVTGLAVTTWPAFLPVALALIAVMFYCQDKCSERIRNLVKFASTCIILPLVLWIPQYIALTRKHLMGHGSIGQWKGIPDLGWLVDLIIRFLTQGGFDKKEHWVTALFGFNYVMLIGLAILGYRSLKGKGYSKRFFGIFLSLMLISIPLVHYVFFFMYSRRVQVIFSILIIVLAVYYLLTQLNRKYRLWGFALLIWVILFSNGWNVYMAHKYVMETKGRYETWKKYTGGVLRFIQSNTRSGDFIFATENTYRFVIIGNILRFNLEAHRSGNYYSLNPELAKELSNHYDDILLSNDIFLIKRVLGFYGIRYVLIREGEQAQYPGLKQLYDKCAVGYRDENYAVLKCDAIP